MSTRVARCIEDCHRHGMPVEVVCACGHSEVFDAWKLMRYFGQRRWSTTFSGITDSAYRRFRCSECGKRPVRIGPGYR